MHLFSSKFVNKPAGATEVEGSVTAPHGFVAAGIAAGLKKSGKSDLGLLMSRQPCTSAAMYTPNAAAAPPIRACQKVVDNDAIQVLVVNSGSANACTGNQGYEDALGMIRAAAQAAGISNTNVAVASTGVIGQRLPMELVLPAIERVAGSLSELGGADFAEAIRTTDKVDKEGAIEIELSSGKATIGACAKGAGMIAPNMATTLIFVTSDVAAPAEQLKRLLGQAVKESFNSVTVDGDMSTNDCIFLLANGSSGSAVEPGTEDEELFTAALKAVCKGLALKMVEDGEGATKVVELKVKSAAGEAEAERVAAAIANSPLVKTAFYGRDPNWGRLMASAGAALAGEPALDADIYYEDQCVARGGAASLEPPDEARLKEIMGQSEISVTIDLHRGEAEKTMYFSDLGHDYITLNAEYTT
jgi:glutamate N-acetyltransferase/amino-acid N-acetyltransferase